MIKYLVLVPILLIPTYIFRFTIFSIPTNVFEFSVLLAGLTFLIVWLSNYLSGKAVKCNFGYLATYLLILAAAISIYFSADKSTALGILKGWFIVPVILYLLVINYYPKERTKDLSLAIFIPLMIVSIWATLQKIGVISTLFYQVGDPGFADYLSRFRAFGPFESPNYLAMFVVPSIFLSLPIFGYFKGATNKLLLSTLYIFPLYALYASHSLGGLLAFGFASIVYFAFQTAKIHRLKILNSSWKMTGLVLALIVVAAIFALTFSSIGSETYSRSMRIDIYRYAWDLAKNHPIFGIGLGQFQAAARAISLDNLGFQLYGLSYALHPHNLFLSYWLSLGILGLAAFIILIINFFVRLGRSKSDVALSAGLFAAMTAILIHGLIDTTYFKNDLSAIFWLIMALSLLLEIKKKRSKEIGTN
ncbi:MAG: O-antigen ligase family protein [Patescibacteria group bacterium]|jgi:putative inorganic carbon (HCO3(-)) transporter|nr:O-antigen ligase family protein [Patescibacteria group bacterium]